MKRRNVLSSLVVGPAAARAAFAQSEGRAAGKSEASMAREYYELRLYHLRRGPKVRMFDDFLREAALPAMKRAGIGPVGFFNTSIGPDNPTIYMLLTYKSLDAFGSAYDRVSADADYQKAGKDFIDLPATDPGYVRMESSLMVSFEGIPKLEVPEARSEARLFELRTYESHSKKANRKKIEMFNKGEIAIFRRAGLQPVFFGETLIGSRLPNLTYMLAHDNMAARDKNWAAFGADAEWKKLSATPGYTDPEIVSSISNVLLRPTAYSQIR
ncbi:MAG TPA: NIPSNAP family protein [Acidobacteriota bacterium]|jgi:hypothetical protein